MLIQLLSSGRNLKLQIARQALSPRLLPRSGRAPLRTEGCTLPMGVMVNLVFPLLIAHVFAHEKPEYGLPVDDDELDRLDMNHQKYTLLQNNKLFLAPITPTPQKILDLGTRDRYFVDHTCIVEMLICLPGIFAIDIADMYPSAKVLEKRICGPMETSADEVRLSGQTLRLCNHNGMKADPGQNGLN